MKPPPKKEVLQTLKDRFESHMHRHTGIAWAGAQASVEKSTRALKTLGEMEAAGGEPDVIGLDKATGQSTFSGCAAATPSGRWSHPKAVPCPL